MLRGDVYRFRPPKGIGHGQHGDRFGVVVRADGFLPRSAVIVAPTSRRARAASFRPEIDMAGERSRVLVEQLAAVDAQRLGSLMGLVTPEEMWGIEVVAVTDAAAAPAAAVLGAANGAVGVLPALAIRRRVAR